MTKSIFSTTNRIKDILPENWRVFNSLKTLDLSGNWYIKGIAAGGFKLLENLDTLRLEKSSIPPIQKGMREGLRSLTTLDLKFTDHRSNDSAKWHGLISLETLYLSYNNIHELSAGYFSGLPKLKFLDLTSNDLKVLRPDIFNPEDYPDSNGHPAQLTLSLGGNYFPCDNGLCLLQEAEKEWIKWGSYKPYCKDSVYPLLEWDDIKRKFCPVLGISEVLCFFSV